MSIEADILDRRGVVVPINFVPERGRILICDYRKGRVDPEMDKVRRVVVVSPRSYNGRHGDGPGRCLVVPFSATHPGTFLSASDVFFEVGAYRCLSVTTWAICSAIMSASHDRLDRVRVGATYSKETLSEEDRLRIETGLRHACGFP